MVNFIVRAVDDLLKDKFDIKAGLADHRRVTVLDFACGTGTFLLEVFEKIFANIGGPEVGRADQIVREHMLKNVFGFEYLIAPYTIAHLKLSQYLRDKGHPLKDSERLQVFLTNTLEPIEPQKNAFLPAIAEEVEAAQSIKDRKILVIVGNPPYSGNSKNKGEWTTRSIDGYKYTVERNAEGLEENKPLGERNPKWLNDDYVKFIRFAQLKMDAVDEGIVGIITNHSWLDNPTFRGMRQSLMRSFNQIHVLDLHGNHKKKEQAPDGSKDENVFDIEQGVAISIFVKRKGLERGVWRGDLWGKRLEKYRVTAQTSLKDNEPVAVSPVAPHYLYQMQDAGIRSEYEVGWPLPKMMPQSSVGIVTSRDRLAIAFTKNEITERVADFASRTAEDARQHYELGKDVRDWRVAWAQKDVVAGGSVVPIHYRPFDRRLTYYTGRSRGFHVYPRHEISRHIRDGNIALITSRLTKGEDFRHVQITDTPAEVICMSPNTSNNGFVFPLRVDKGQENLAPAFRAFLDARYSHHHTPEDILGYIYAVLHAPSYRACYAEFLRIDFPRIPFPETLAHFDALAALGSALIDIHLLRRPGQAGLATYHGKGDHKVEAVRYAEADNSVHINSNQCFRPVPQAVWDFHIGGYQVIDKYLKSRKGRVLSLDETTHVAAIAGALATTITQMQAIDAAYRAAFPDRG